MEWDKKGMIDKTVFKTSLMCITVNIGVPCIVVGVDM